jgi:hypothetical protein
MFIVVASSLFLVVLFVLMLLCMDGIMVDWDGNNMRLNNNWVSVGLIREVETFSTYFLLM